MNSSRKQTGAVHRALQHACWDLSDKRYQYLSSVYVGGAVAILFYLLEFNFTYHVTEYNVTLVPLYGLFLATPGISCLTRDYTKTAVWTLLVGSLALLVLLYSAGGVQAPGAFWLASLPMAGGVLLGFRGSLIGAIINLGALAGFSALEKIAPLPNVIRDLGIYEPEKVVNLWVFGLFSAGVVYFFIRNESRYQERILVAQQRTENLLRILMHDVASPLMVIESYGELLKESELAPNHRKKVDIMAQQARHLVGILEQIRDMKAVADGKLKVSMARVDLDRSINEAIEIHRHKIDLKKINIVRDIQIGCQVEAEPTLLRSIVLGNVVSNAVKFSPIGGTIEVGVWGAGGSVVIQIRDFGVGMPKEILDGLFELNKATSRRGTNGEKGTGYGMILIKEWASRFGGTIEVESYEAPEDGAPTEPSQRDSGTVIRLIFPCAKKQAQAA